MKVVGVAASLVGTKTKVAMELAMATLAERHPEVEARFIDLGEKTLRFSDGRNVRDYEGDTRDVAEALMEADALLIGTPTFQASIPGTLKNLFDLLPVDAFRNKVVGVIATAGSAKHYLMVETQLKPILSYMKAQIVPAYVFLEEKDFLRHRIVNDDIVFRIRRLVDDLVGLTAAFASLRREQEAGYGF